MRRTSALLERLEGRLLRTSSRRAHSGHPGDGGHWPLGRRCSATNTRRAALVVGRVRLFVMSTSLERRELGRRGLSHPPSTNRLPCTPWRGLSVAVLLRALLLRVLLLRVLLLRVLTWLPVPTAVELPEDEVADGVAGGVAGRPPRPVTRCTALLMPVRIAPRPPVLVVRPTALAMPLKALTTFLLLPPAPPATFASCASANSFARFAGFLIVLRCVFGLLRFAIVVPAFPSPLPRASVQLSNRRLRAVTPAVPVTKKALPHCVVFPRMDGPRCCADRSTRTFCLRE